MGLENVMDTPHICKREGVLGGHTEAIKDLKEYRDKQNGALLRLADLQKGISTTRGRIMVVCTTRRSHSTANNGLKFVVRQAGKPVFYYD